MLQFYESINNVILKHNTTFKNKINLICDNSDICDKLAKKYDVNTIKNDDCSKIKCLTIIYIDSIFDNDIIKCINTLTNNKLKVCLIVKLHFDFNKLIRQVNVNDIDAISWYDNDKKFEYYLIVL